MTKIRLLFFIGIFNLAFAQNHEQIEIAQKAQKDLDIFYKNPNTSPLQKADLKNFRGLEFYPISNKYIVEARFVKAQKDSIFEMKTTGSRLPKYTIYGCLYFEIEGKSFKLNVYQNKDTNRKAEYSNYLFLPFSDTTCGQTSYIGGRYMDLQLPLSEKVILNFNTAYNPYCAYNHQYSCPIIPLENDLPIAILAGVKKYQFIPHDRVKPKNKKIKTYQHFIDFKLLDPMRFWTAIFIAISLIIYAIWRFSRRKSIIEPITNKRTTLTTVVEKESVQQVLEVSKEKTILEKPKTKVYTKTLVKGDLEVNEPKDIFNKPSEEKQEKAKPKVEIIEDKPKAKPKSEEQLPKAKEETAKSKGEIYFVNYDILKVQRTNSYPIFRFPKKGTVVRSFRFGNTKRRGFKEESFQKSIEQYFGKDFTVLGNIRLNTGKETRPFEPDIAIVDKSNSNLRIDIEIDEPYAGLSRQPTHCRGEDVNRDNYFIDRGWVVIRFSEYQVHLQEKDCLRYIAETIKLAIPNYEIPSQLLNQPSLQVEKLWDLVQAQKWEKVKYREQYLNHTFQSIEEQTETIERDFDEQEFNEEQFVKPTLIGEVDDKKSITYNLKNQHPRDSRIKFYPEPHIYTIDNTPAPSASTIIAKFFPEFDSVYWANRKAAELGMTPIEVELMWKNKGEAAAKKGTFLHEQIENFYLKQVYERTEEFHLFENFVRDHNHIKPFRTEWRIFDEQHHIAGTIDLISENGNGYEMYDWKRSKKVVNSFNGEPIKNNQWQSGVGQLSDIDDTSYNRYCLQQSLYKYILEKNYGIKVSKMYLIVLYPEYDKYYKVEVPYLKDKAEYILKTL